MSSPKDKIYLLIELVADGLSPHQIQREQNTILRKFQIFNIKSYPVPAPLEEGAMGGDRYKRLWVAELPEADRNNFQSQMQGQNVQVTTISQTEKDNFLKNNQPNPEKK